MNILHFWDKSLLVRRSSCFNSQLRTLSTKLICQHWTPSAQRPRLPPRLSYFLTEFLLYLNFNRVILELLSVEDKHKLEFLL